MEVDSQDRGMFSASSGDDESRVINPFGAQEYDHPVWGKQMQGYTFDSMRYFVELLTLMKNGTRSLGSLAGKYPDGESAMVSTRIGAAVDRSLAQGKVIEL